MKITSLVASLALFGVLAGSAHGALFSTTTNDGNGADSYVQATNSATTNFGNSPELRVKNEADTSGGFNRKTYLRFDISGRPAGPITGGQLDISLLDPVSTAGTNGGNLTWNFNVYGLNDGAAGQNWIESGGGSITWNNAPANVVATGPGFGNGVTGDATFLGLLSPSIVGRGSNGATYSLTSPALDTFLNNDSDGLTTFIITRVEPQDGSNTVVHVFSSGEDAGAANPTLSFDVIPEPGTASLLGLGLVGLLARRRR